MSSLFLDSKALQEYSNDWQTDQVGILLGNVSHDGKASVLFLLAMGRVEDLQAGGAPLLLDKAAQIADFMIGGLKGIGVFSTANKTSLRLSLLDDLALAIQKEVGVKESPAFVLNIGETAKLSAKEVTGSGSKAALKACTVQLKELHNDLRLITCRHVIRSQCYPSGSEQSVSELAALQLDREAGYLKNTHIALRGQILRGSDLVRSAWNKSGQNSNSAQLFCSASCRQVESDAVRDISSEADGALALQCTVAGMAYVDAHDTIATATRSLEADVQNSLRIRAEILRSEDQAKGTASSNGSCHIELPQRVFVDAQNGLRLTTCAIPGESAEMIYAGFREATPINAHSRDIQWPEKHASVRSPEPGRRKELGGLGEGRPNVPFGFKSGQQVVWASTLVCLLSCLVSYYIFSSLSL